VRSFAAHEAAALAADHLASIPADIAQSGRHGLPFVVTIVHDVAMFKSEAVTRDVRVSVASEYAPARSRPQANEWFFLYTITIANEGAAPVQLISRHWIITNGAGEVEEVRGPGVIGQQPVIAPGESFTYTSGCPLTTQFGTMEGTYQMVSSSGEAFDVRIAAFTLSEPYSVQH
jgi:ApaG protein